MSMFSEIKAEADLAIITKAIKKAKAKATTQEAKDLLDEVLTYCRANIGE